MTTSMDEKVTPSPSEAPPPAAPRRRRKHSGMVRSQRRAGYVLMAPAMVNISIFLGLPLVLAFILSFTDYGFFAPPEFIGIDNYIEMAGDPDFQISVVNTIVYTIMVVPVAMALALIVALALNMPIRARGTYRVMFYVPVVTATVSVATVWLWILNPSFGLANQILALFGLPPSQWLNSPDTALMSLAMVGIWQGLGAKMVIYLAALQGVDPALVEAARLDGANRWQVFWNVTWPSLGPAHFFVFVTSIIASFQVFDLVYVTTQGGPANATRVLVYDIYQNAFSRLQLGYASAESVFMFALIAVFIAAGLWLQRSKSE
ncbi:carbohydrate ABC transporter permease [Microbacterium aquimaris]|uniref:Sugar ABC transporter permease n=1 Tax=Microbacterium aquimaris TaxID=459816 RepID=A0ABU5N2P8_9MICO|nr:sugar ABC transporter permease [Microbacterium aquimaris]MDZ8160349.1 sugar ABC transporter permease [Microbacterium aquimaris]